MPLYKHYTKQIESEVADIRNTGKTRYGVRHLGRERLVEWVKSFKLVLKSVVRDI